MHPLPLSSRRSGARAGPRPRPLQHRRRRLSGGGSSARSRWSPLGQAGRWRSGLTRSPYPSRALYQPKSRRRSGQRRPRRAARPSASLQAASPRLHRARRRPPGARRHLRLRRLRSGPSAGMWTVSSTTCWTDSERPLRSAEAEVCVAVGPRDDLDADQEAGGDGGASRERGGLDRVQLAAEREVALAAEVAREAERAERDVG